MPYRVDFRTRAADALDRLIDLGALDVESAPDGGLTVLMPDAVPPERLARLVGADDLRVSPAVGRDAESVWRLRRHPVHVGRIRIVPAEGPAAPGDLRLIDAPAFGTGLHPTTALCLDALGDAIGRGNPPAALDIGTGSGVLALAALLLGVPRALGVDIDDDALRTAADNARLNGLDGRLRLLRGGPQEVTGGWPLILANLLAAPLVEMAPSLVRLVGHEGELVLSGIRASLQTDVEEPYRHLGMRRVHVAHRAGWAALVLRASW